MCVRDSIKRAHIKMQVIQFKVIYSEVYEGIFMVNGLMIIG